MRGGAPHVTCVVPLQGDGVHADRGLAAGPLGPRARGHQMAKGLRRRGLLHLPPLAPRVSLDLPRVFHVCLILRGFLFIFQALRWEDPVLRINQVTGDSGSEERWEWAWPAVPRPCSFQFRLYIWCNCYLPKLPFFFPGKNLKFDNLLSTTLSKKEREAKVSL